MIFFKKLSIFLVILFFATSFPLNVSTAIEFQANLKQNATNSSNSVTGNVSVIILNQNGFYSASKINKLTNYLKNDLHTKTGLNFNVSTLEEENIKLEEFVGDTLNHSYIQNAILIGPIDSHSNLFGDILYNWSDGDILTHIKHFGIVDYKSTEQFSQRTRVQNITFVDFNVEESGFMSGLKAATLTTSNHIGLIIDKSNQVSFKYKFYSYYDFNTDEFVKRFISGIQYASEHLKNNNEILLKVDLFNPENDPSSAMDTLLNNFVAFGADTVFNYNSKYDDIFLEKTANLKLNSGIYGDNNSEATFSFIEDTNLAIENLISFWNSTTSNESSVQNYFKYGLENKSVMHLSSYLYTDSVSLTSIQDLVINGTINLNSLVFEEEIIPGFEFSLTMFTIFTILVTNRRIKRLKDS